MNEVYENIANMETKQSDEIQLKVHDYCEGRRQEMSKFIAEKKLVSEEEDGIDCLMGFLENEMKQIYSCLRERPSTVISKLWTVMEEELTTWFEGRKKRNLQKNKPERFRHVAEAITIIIEVKGLKSGHCVGNSLITTFLNRFLVFIAAVAKHLLHGEVLY